MANHRASEIKVEDKLRSMKGRTYTYNTMNVQILSWKYDGDVCTIVTSGPWVHRKTHEMLKFIEDNFLEVETDDDVNQTALTKREEEPVLMPNIKGLPVCDSLLDEIMDSVKGIKGGRETPEQVGKVAELAGKVIGITKVQLEAFKLANELHRNR